MPASGLLMSDVRKKTVMKTTEKEGALAANNSRRGGRGRGSRGHGGGRGGGRSGGRGGSDQRRSASLASHAGAGGNHGRRPRQPAKSSDKPQSRHDQTHRGGRGKGRPRSSSHSEKNHDYCKINKSGPYVHLFCSERHAFALSRVFYPVSDDHFMLPSQHIENSNTRRIASDAQLEKWWESVKIVRCQVFFNESGQSTSDANNLSFLERCPICLDEEMVCPFIAPCGHAFCLSCVLGYLNSVVKELNNESGARQAKGGASKTRVSVTSVRARCPLCSSGSSTEINAGEVMITYKDLRPVAFVPTLAITPACSGETQSCGGKKNIARESKPPQTGIQIKFVKLHRVKSSPTAYVPSHGNRVRGVVSEEREQQLPDLLDGDDDAEDCVYARQYFAGLIEYERVLQHGLDDLNNYRESTVHCQLDVREDWNVKMAIEAIHAAQKRWLGSLADTGGFRQLESDAKAAATAKIDLGDTLFSETCVESSCAGDGSRPSERSKKNVALLQPGALFLPQSSNESHSSLAETDQFLYYQSSDGQLCFLSGINVACLMHEFSLHKPLSNHRVGFDGCHSESNADESNADDKKGEDIDSVEKREEDETPLVEDRQKGPIKARNTFPLPDELTATVLQIEKLSVTPALLKRKPFLSHIPLTSSVSFVEVDWYTGGSGKNKPMLSHATLSKFRGELQRRRSERLRAAKREEKADKFAQAKSEKEEQRRRRELLGSNYAREWNQQIIDPDDDFFAPALPGRAEEDAQWSRSATFQFNEVCAAGGAWPELSSSPNHGRQETATSALPPAHLPTAAVSTHSSLPPTCTTWGSGNQNAAAKAPAAKAHVNHFPSLGETSLTILSTQTPRSRCSKKVHKARQFS